MPSDHQTQGAGRDPLIGSSLTLVGPAPQAFQGDPHNPPSMTK